MIKLKSIIFGIVLKICLVIILQKLRLEKSKSWVIMIWNENQNIY